MKKIFLIPVLVMGLWACNNKPEPVPVVVPSTKINTAALAKYKSNLDSRKIVVGMHYEWGTSPAYSLINTPDSLDIIVLKDNYEYPSPLMLKDLYEVQILKATRVVPSLDLEAVSRMAMNMIKEKYTQEKILQDVAWAQNNNKPSDDIVAKTYQDLKQKVTKNEVQKATDWLQGELKLIPNFMQMGYNGISIRLPQDNTIFEQSMVENALKTITSVAGVGQKYMFIVESPVEIYHKYIEKANYIIGYIPEDNNYNSFVTQSQLYPNNKYLPACSAKDDKLNDGYINYPVFTPNKLTKEQELLHFSAPNAAGVAIYHSEVYYFDTQNINGYTNPYYPLKEDINILSVSNK